LPELRFSDDTSHVPVRPEDKAAGLVLYPLRAVGAVCEVDEREAPARPDMAGETGKERESNYLTAKG